MMRIVESIPCRRLVVDRQATLADNVLIALVHCGLIGPVLLHWLWILPSLDTHDLDIQRILLLIMALTSCIFGLVPWWMTRSWARLEFDRPSDRLEVREWSALPWLSRSFSFPLSSLSEAALLESAEEEGEATEFVLQLEVAEADRVDSFLIPLLSEHARDIGLKVDEIFRQKTATGDVGL